jgi:multiple sugar transport system substrate-binding protein
MARMRLITVPLTISLAALLAVGCGGDDGGSGGGDGGGGDAGTAAKDAPTLAEASENPEGEIALCIGKDTSGIHTKLVERFNAENEGADAKLIELPEAADEQRNQMVQRLRAESAECDLLGLDVVWTAEFAAQGWLADTGSLVDERGDEFIESTLETARYDERYWAVPYNSNAGFIFYRTDQVDEMPASWQDLYEQAGAANGVVYQGARYEGLTVHFLELLYGNGGEVLNDDGTEATADSDEAREVLQFMVDGIESGAAPKAVTTFKEEEARRAFEGGRATFERNWPYAYSLGQESAIKGKFEVAAFPKFGDGDPAGVIGGYNLAVSAYTDNPGGAAALIDFLTSLDAQVESGKVATPPVLTEAYDDAGVQEAMPFAETLRDAIAQGRARPVSPVYPQISEAISTNVHQALTGAATVDEAVAQMDEDITEALDTF